MIRAKLKLGDVFEVSLADGKVGFFQYIADDETQLDSNVIRIFRDKYDAGEFPVIPKIVSGNIHFNAHIFLKAGLKFGFWKKVGNAVFSEKIDLLFRNTNDYGTPEIKVSHRWYIWRINEPFRNVGVLRPEYQDAEIGVVLSPGDIIDRMKTGSYTFAYPGY